MSVIFFEGFDLYGQDNSDTQTGLMSRDVWTSQFLRFSTLARLQPRNNGLDFSPTSGTSTVAPYVHPTSTSLNQPTKRAVAGIAFKSENFAYYGFEDGPTVLCINSAYLYAKLWANGGAPGTYRIEVVCYDTSYWIDNMVHGEWNYIELEYDNTGATSVYKCWLNGSLQVDHTDTSLRIDPHWTGMSGSYGGSDPTYPNRIVYDDMYFLDCMDDSDGTLFQNRLGPIQIRPCPLIADSGSSNWVSNLGGSKYLAVDEQPGPNDLDLSYISTNTAPQTQLFRCSTYDANLPIIAVTSFASVKQPDPSLGVAQFAFRADGNEHIEPLPLQNSYRLFSHNYATLPLGNITASIIEATNFGIRSIQGP